MIKRIFYLLLKQSQIQNKKLEVQVFLIPLLVSLSFAGLLHFCLVLETSALGWTIGLTIGGAKLISKKVTVGLLG